MENLLLIYFLNFLRLIRHILWATVRTRSSWRITPVPIMAVYLDLNLARIRPMKPRVRASGSYFLLSSSNTASCLNLFKIGDTLLASPSFNCWWWLSISSWLLWMICFPLWIVLQYNLVKNICSFLIIIDKI